MLKNIVFALLVGLLCESSMAYTPVIDFILSDNGTDILPQVMDYKIVAGHLVDLGGISFDLDKSAPNFGGSEGQTSEAMVGLHFAWPTSSIPEGLLTLRDFKTDEVVYKLPLFKEITKAKEGKSEPKKAGLAEPAQEEKIPLDTILGTLKSRSLRVCVESTSKDIHSRLCSTPYDLKFEKNEYAFFESDETFKAGVKVDGAKVEKEGAATVVLNGKSSIEVLSDKGSQFVTEFSKILVFPESIHADEDSKQLFLFGHDLKPGKNVVDAENDHWRATMILHPQPSVYFMEKNGFFIRQPFKLTKEAPPLAARYALDSWALNGSYSGHKILHGVAPKNLTVSSTEKEAHFTKEPKFDWEADLPIWAEENKRHIKFKIKGSSASLEKNSAPENAESYLGTYSLYHAMPFELAGNFSIPFTTSSSPLLFGDFYGSAWLEQFFGWDNNALSVHRWGVSVSVLTAIANNKDSLGNSIGFSSIDVDLKYSLTRGLWNHSDMYGPLLVYQKATFSQSSATMFGAGAFWNHKLSTEVDNFLSFGLGFLSHPKWFDLEAETFFASMTSGSTLNGNYNIMGHFKMFVIPNFFAQIGAGFRQYGFSNSAVGIQAGSFQASIGIGYDF